MEIVKDRLDVYGDSIPRNTVSLLMDAVYTVEPVVGPLLEKGLTYVGKLKKDRQIRLFPRWMRVEEYFETYKKERYFTYEGVRVFYKEAVLHVNKLGRVALGQN